MTEREHSHALTSTAPTDDRDAAVPGRISRSGLLRKLDRATASGLIQRRDTNGVAEGAEHAVAAASSSSGSPLPAHLQRKFESSLGADLSGVRVHTGEASANANSAVGAKAYATGQHIHFGAGQYNPSTPAGEHLLAHEVAHTVQQAGRTQYKLQVSTPGDHLEEEADRAADAMVAGRPATTSTSETKLARQAFGAELKANGGDESAIGQDVEGKDVKLGDNGFTAWMLKEAPAATAAQMSVLAARVPVQLMPEYSGFEPARLIRAEEMNWCKNLGRKLPMSSLELMTVPPSVIANWQADAQWCQDDIKSLTKDRDSVTERYLQYNSWIPFAEGYHSSYGRLETMITMVGADPNNPKALITTLNKQLDDAKTVVKSEQKATGGALGPSAQLVSNDQSVGDSVEATKSAFSTLQIEHIKFIANADKEHAATTAKEGDSASARLKAINETKEFISSTLGTVETTMSALAGAPAKIAAASEKLDSAGASLNAKLNVAKIAAGKSPTRNPTYLTKNAAGEIVIKNVQTNTENNGGPKPKEPLPEVETAMPELPAGFKDLAKIATDFYYKKEVDTLVNKLGAIAARCDGELVASEFALQRASALSFAKALVDWASACNKLQHRMAARRDNYFQFGKHLDDIANKNAALTNKGVAAGGNSEKFSTMMALVAAIREVMALGDKGVPAEMEPKNVRAWTNGIVANRTKVPRRSFMKQFSMPAAETERLQDMYNEVSTFNQWHSLVRTTWSPIDTKAGALVSSLTTSGLGDY